MKLSLWDTYLKSNTNISLDHNIKLYSCGPTVYSYQHIGNVVAVMLPQLISNTIKYCGGECTWVGNVTDLGHLTDDGDNGEDKMEIGAKKENKTPAQIAKFYFDDLLMQLKMVNIDYPSGFNNPHATEYIYEQMFIALDLVKSKRAYIIDDGIYFDSNANKDIDTSFLPNSQGDSDFTGRDIVNTTKASEDFALWKFVDDSALQKYRFEDYPKLKNQFEIDSLILAKWGCPGWHTECVAMIAAVLGIGVGYKSDQFSFVNLGKDKGIIDIHTGGEDHIDIHHKNEILQSLALGVKLSDHWVHNKHLKVNNQKMSKSVGNVFNISGDKSLTSYDSIVGKGFNPLAFRLMFLEHDYREQINFTWEKLEQSQNRLHTLYKLGAVFNHVTGNQINIELKSKFQELLLNNLDLNSVLELFQKSLNNLITSMNNGNVDLTIVSTLKELDKSVLMLDIFPSIDQEIVDLANLRYQSKQFKDFEQADIIRTNLQNMGYQVDDYKDRTVVWKKG
jgi:cysteinyl-tRNA synthetase